MKMMSKTRSMIAAAVAAQTALARVSRGALCSGVVALTGGDCLGLFGRGEVGSVVTASTFRRIRPAGTAVALTPLACERASAPSWDHFDDTAPASPVQGGNDTADEAVPPPGRRREPCWARAALTWAGLSSTTSWPAATSRATTVRW